MAVRSKLKRAGAAVVGVSTLMMLSALPASAEAASGRLDGGENGYNADMGDGKFDNLATILMNLKITEGEKTLKVYCVQIDVSAQHDREMIEHDWDKYPDSKSPFNKNKDKINWVLHHGFPVQDTDAIEKTLKDEGVELNDGLSEKEAITATQAAAWHFSDDKDLNLDRPIHKGSEQDAADVVALYKYLTGDNNDGGSDQPTPALEVSPKEASGEAGSKVGPFAVKTNGEITDLTSDLPEGVKVTDEDGNELALADITNDVEFWIDVPADAEDGSGKVGLKASAEVDTGRLFVADNYDKDPAQSLIVAKSEKHDLKAGVNVDWKAAAPVPTPTTETPAPTTESEVVPPAPTSSEAPKPSPVADEDDLADTGASIMTPILIGVGLLAAGAGALFLQRRRNA